MGRYTDRIRAACQEHRDADAEFKRGDETGDRARQDRADRASWRAAENGARALIGRDPKGGGR